MKEDEKLLKVLVSDTRRDILKLLSEAKRTPSDISRLLKKGKSTIVEHLEKLVDAGLVEKQQKPGEKFVFYSLTEKGRSLISRKSRSLIIVLVTSIFSLITSIFYLRKYILSTKIQENFILKSQATSSPNYLYISLIFLFLFIALIFLYKKLR
ncbi:MAG: ArsR family transcriptional regulator [Candidatus Aenigmatarchaeota archaeon]